jgi:hypothetical protein
MTAAAAPNRFITSPAAAARHLAYLLLIIGSLYIGLYVGLTGRAWASAATCQASGGHPYTGTTLRIPYTWQCWPPLPGPPAAGPKAVAV